MYRMQYAQNSIRSIYTWFIKNIQHFISLLWMNIRYYTIFAFSFDAVLGSIVMLLMMERYNSGYLKLVSILDKCKIFCCCTRLVEKYVLGEIDGKIEHAQSFSNYTDTDTNNTHKTKSGGIIKSSHTFNSSNSMIIGTPTPNEQLQDQEESIDTKTAVPVLDRPKTYTDCEKEYTVNIQMQ